MPEKKFWAVSLRTMKTVFYLLITVIIFSCSKSEKITPEEVSIAIQRFDKAWKDKNAGGVDSILADQYVYFTQSGGIFDRANTVKTAASPEYVLESAERSQVSVSIRGNTAVVNTIWKGKGTYFGKPFDDTQRCSVTLVKVNGEVRILGEHCTVIKL